MPCTCLAWHDTATTKLTHRSVSLGILVFSPRLIHCQTPCLSQAGASELVSEIARTHVQDLAWPCHLNTTSWCTHSWLYVDALRHVYSTQQSVSPESCSSISNTVKQPVPVSASGNGKYTLDRTAYKTINLVQVQQPPMSSTPFTP